MVGYWNRMIFSPDWIARMLFDGAKVAIEVPLANPQGPPRFTVGDVRLLVTAQRVMVLPTKEDEDTLRRVEATAIKILELLPHTPVTAVGINFQFVESEPSADLAELFRFRDTQGIAGIGFETASWGVARRLTKADFVLNFASVLEDNHVTFDFNFHSEVTGAQAAATYLRDRVNACHAIATETLGTYQPAPVPEA
jgi:hypothetical protein